MPTIQALPRTAVTTYLKLARLPLDAAERVLHLEDASPAALFFEDFEARVKDLAATVLSDDVLRQDAVLQRVRVAQLRRAVELEAEAERTRTEADGDLARRREQADEARQQADQKAAADEARVERERREAEERAAAKAADAKRAVEAKAEADRARVEREERAAEAKRLKAENVALAEKRDALQAADEAVRLDSAAKTVKQRRKSPGAA